MSQHQTGVSFDEVGTFGGALLISADTMLFGYSSSGTVLFTYTLPAAFSSTYVLQGATVAPLTYTACAGCLFVTAMPSSNINAVPAGNGEIFVVQPGTASPGTLTPFLTTTGIPEPESIQFVTNNALACTIGTGGFSYFVSGTATDNQFGNPFSTTGAILAWTSTQLSPYVGHFLVEDEQLTGGGRGAIYVDGSLGSVFSDTTTSTNTAGFQLEDSAIIQCPGGCPATFGFYKHFGLPASMPLTIGCHTYTLAELQNILATPPAGGNAVDILAHQLIAALANYAANATKTVAASQAIAAAEGLLCSNNLVMGSSVVHAGTALGGQLTAVSDTLDTYNSSAGTLGCSEGAGLILN